MGAAQRLANHEQRKRGGQMRRIKYSLVLLAGMLLLGIASVPASADFVGKEGKSKATEVVFTFGEVTVKCPKASDKYVILEDAEKQSPAGKGHISAKILYEECEAVGLGKVPNFECSIELKPNGTAKFLGECTLTLPKCCPVTIEGPPFNQNLRQVSYVNLKNGVEVNQSLSGITYKSGGVCTGKIASKASNGTYKDPYDLEEGLERNGNQCTGIKSSGSVLQAAMMSEYTKVFITECEVAPTVEYKATSSSKALKEWGSEKGELNGTESGNGTTVDKLIASDLPPEKGQIENMDIAGKEKESNNSLVTVPVAQSAVAVLVSLPAACSASALEKPHVEDLGLEEEWAAKKGTLEELVKNGGIAGCSTTESPKLIVRNDPASATAGFKRFMNEVVKANWSKYASPLKVAESNEWPAAVEKTSEGGEAEAKAVYATPDSMGYADLADAKAAGFTSTPSQHKNGTEQYYSFIVEVQNQKESQTKYASPEILESEVAASNCKAAAYTEPEGGVAPNADWSKSGESNSLVGNTYPICTLTYDLAWQHYAFLESEIFLQEQYADTVQSYIQWLLKTGQEEKTLKSDHLAPLATGIDEKAKTAAANDIGL